MTLGLAVGSESARYPREEERYSSPAGTLAAKGKRPAPGVGESQKEETAPPPRPARSVREPTSQGPGRQAEAAAAQAAQTARKRERSASEGRSAKTASRRSAGSEDHPVPPLPPPPPPHAIAG
jgi:hypothetical protein